MKERSLVVFTVLGQAAAGMVAVLLLVVLVAAPGARLVPSLLVAGALLAGAAGTSFLHLGSPTRAWRAVANLRTSWLSREILLLGLFAAGWLGLVAAYGLELGSAEFRVGLLGAAAATGMALVVAMSRVYRLRTVPAWDTWLTSADFALTAVALGGLGAAITLALGSPATPLGPAVGDPVPAAGARLSAAAGAAALLALLVLEPLRRRHRRRSVDRVDAGLWPEAGAGGRSIPGRVALLLVAVVTGGGAALGTTTLLLGPALAAAVPAVLLGRSGFYREHARVGV